MIIRLILIFFLIGAFNESVSQNNDAMKKKGQKLNKKEVENILKEFNGKVDRSLLDSIPTDVYGDEEIYRLSDGRILFKLSKGDGMVYSSLKDILELFTTDHVSKIPKVDEKFLTRIPALIKELSDSLKLNLSTSDKLDDLLKLDSAIKAKGGITSINVEEHLLPLVAYCGQVIVNETGGVWEVRRENEGEPQLFVKGSGDKLYDPYNPVLKEIIDASDEFSFAGIIYQIVKPFKLNVIGGQDN